MASILNNTTNGQIVFADYSTDFSSGSPNTAANSLINGTIAAGNQIQMDCTSVSNGGGRQSAVCDFGTDRPPLYRLDACIEHGTAPTDGVAIDFWLACSPNSGATGNPAGLGASDAAFAYTRGKAGQMEPYSGSMQLANTAVNIGFVMFVRPTHRYGILVMVNNSNGTLHSAMDETHFVLTPVEYDQSA